MILGKGQPWHEQRRRTLPVEPPRWSFLFDSPWWGDGRTYFGDMPWRINMWTPWGWLGIALTPGSRFVSSWNPVTRHYDDRTHWIQWAPR